MTKNAVIMKRKAIEAIKMYQDELLKEFLLIRPKLQEKLQNLLEEGIASKEYVCLEDAETYADISYTIISKENALEMIQILKSINLKNAMELFDEYTRLNDWPTFCDFKEFQRMIEIHDAYKNAKFAEDMLN